MNTGFYNVKESDLTAEIMIKEENMLLKKDLYSASKCSPALKRTVHSSYFEKI